MPDDRIVLPSSRHGRLLTTSLWVVGGLLILGVFSLIAVRVAHHGKLLPGAQAYGVYLGDMEYAKAQTYLDEQTQNYIDQSTIVVNTAGADKMSVPAKEVELTYDTATSISELGRIGRRGNPLQQLTDQISLMLGTYPLPRQPITYNSVKLFTIVAPAYSVVNKPSVNASIAITDKNQPTIIEATTGKRVNLTGLLSDLDSVWGRLENSAVTIQSSPQPAAVQSSNLQPHMQHLSNLTTSPLILTYQQKKWSVPTNEVLAWFSYSNESGPLTYDRLGNYYQVNTHTTNDLSLDTSRIGSYVQRVAKDVNQKAVDAQLTIQGDRATVFKQSQDGRELDTRATTQKIIEALDQPSIPNVELAVKNQTAEVSDANLEKLGIKELLSEGYSTFPGSSANRLTNVRVGAARYQGVLLKPGQIFSFGEILGEVGAAQGYKESHVILEGRQENQYGGGLCQVSSTAYRAALLAGLQIVERYNHAFAISYYTAPFGVPGVDATIYYPQVDFKFKNDTSHYILIQTEMVGSTLKFRFYGTKEKEGVIRGPFFVSGSSNPNAPSKTVFYRDIKVNGVVTKTDTVYTTYRSALDYPSAN